MVKKLYKYVDKRTGKNLIRRVINLIARLLKIPIKNCNNFKIL